MSWESEFNQLHESEKKNFFTNEMLERISVICLITLSFVCSFVRSLSVSHTTTIEPLQFDEDEKAHLTCGMCVCVCQRIYRIVCLFVCNRFCMLRIYHAGCTLIFFKTLNTLFSTKPQCFLFGEMLGIVHNCESTVLCHDLHLLQWILMSFIRQNSIHGLEYRGLAFGSRLICCAQFIYCPTYKLHLNICIWLVFLFGAVRSEFEHTHTLIPSRFLSKRNFKYLFFNFIKIPPQQVYFGWMFVFCLSLRLFCGFWFSALDYLVVMWCVLVDSLEDHIGFCLRKIEIKSKKMSTSKWKNAVESNCRLEN